MSYGYDFDDREVLDIRELTRADTCPASWPSPGPTSWESRDAAPPLVRWVAVRDAIQAWQEAQDPDVAVAAALGHLDPVQREVCDDLVRAYQRSIHRLDSIRGLPRQLETQSRPPLRTTAQHLASAAEEPTCRPVRSMAMPNTGELPTFRAAEHPPDRHQITDDTKHGARIKAETNRNSVD